MSLSETSEPPSGRADGDSVSVLVVDDHALFRRGLRSLLTEAGLEVAGDAASGEEALALAVRRKPDVVLMDLNMPGMSGVEATRALAEGRGPSRVVMLTISGEEGDVLDAIDAGAIGYLVKDASAERIVEGVRAAARGDSVLSPRVARLLMDRARGQARANARLPAAEQVSERETQVLRLLAEGCDNAEIGERLFLSTATVKRDVSALLAKFGAENRVQAAMAAARAGLI